MASLNHIEEYLGEIHHEVKWKKYQLNQAYRQLKDLKQVLHSNEILVLKIENIMNLLEEI